MSIKILFTDADDRWRISTPVESEAYQLDNNAHKLSVVGELPDGYLWTMYVSVYGKYKNSIMLTRDDEGASATLSADDLAYGDTKYAMQLVGVKDNITRKTNEISVYIPRSLIDGDADWPDSPDVFEQAQAAVIGAMKKAPRIIDDFWHVWDTVREEYVSTGVQATGEDGKNYGVVVDGSVDNILELKSVEASVDVVVNSVEELADTVAEEVTVIQDDSYFGSGETVRFMVARNLDDGTKQALQATSYAHLQRNNGDFMVPKPRYGSISSAVPADQLGAVIASYMPHNEILYGDGRGALNPSFDPDNYPATGTDAADLPTMDCSTFAALVTRGISYENSRYVSGVTENIPSDYAGLNLPRNPTSLSVAREAYNVGELGMFYAEQNRLFWIDYDREHPASQLQTGDLIMWSDKSVQPKRYMYLGHVAVVLETYPDNDVVLIAEAGGAPNETTLPVRRSDEVDVSDAKVARMHNNIKITKCTITRDSGAIVYARPQYKYQAQSAAQMISDALFAEDVESPTEDNKAMTLVRLYTKKAFEANKMYTLVLEGDFPNDADQNDRLTLCWENEARTSVMHQRVNARLSCGEKLTFPFVPPETVSIRPNLRITVLRPSGTEADGKTYNLRKVALYEGLLPGVEPALEHVRGSNAFFDTSVVTVVSSSAARNADDGKLHLNAVLRLKSTVSDSGELTVGTIPASVLPQRNTAWRLLCTVGSSVRPATVSSVGAINVWFESSDETSDDVMIDFEL